MEDELKIVKRIQRGQKKYFSEIIKEYKKVVFNHSCSFLRNREEAEDATQEIFVNIYNNIKKFRGDSKLSTWIYRITVNVCKNKLKQLQRLRAPILEEAPGDDEEAESDRNIRKLREKKEKEPDEIFFKSNTKNIIYRRIGELTEEQRNVIVLRDIDGLSYEEMAKILKLSVSAVKSKLFRARENLREKLEKDDVL